MGDGETGCPSVVRSVFGLVQACGGIGTCKNTTGLWIFCSGSPPLSLTPLTFFLCFYFHLSVFSWVYLLSLSLSELHRSQDLHRSMLLAPIGCSILTVKLFCGVQEWDNPTCLIRGSLLNR